MNTGIYEIRNSVNGKRHIGSAVNFDKQLGIHPTRANTVIDGHAYSWVSE